MKTMVNEILDFHKIIESESQNTPYSQISVNVYLKQGVPQIRTLNLVKQKRTKFSDIEIDMGKNENNKE